MGSSLRTKLRSEGIIVDAKQGIETDVQALRNGTNVSRLVVPIRPENWQSRRV